MVVYNFHSVFAPLVESGQKPHTIRAPRKRHAQPGEPVQLYTGMRTKSCRKLLIPDPICVEVKPIILRSSYAYEFGSFKVEMDDRILEPEEIQQLAIADGFKHVADSHPAWFSMMEFFRQTHGLPFQGFLIQWKVD